MQLRQVKHLWAFVQYSGEELHHGRFDECGRHVLKQGDLLDHSPVEMQEQLKLEVRREVVVEALDVMRVDASLDEPLEDRADGAGLPAGELAD